MRKPALRSSPRDGGRAAANRQANSAKPGDQHGSGGRFRNRRRSEENEAQVGAAAHGRDEAVIDGTAAAGLALSPGAAIAMPLDNRIPGRPRRLDREGSGGDRHFGSALPSSPPRLALLAR
jgi:hypothetical protein